MKNLITPNELGRRMALENPCEQGSEEYSLWIAGVMMGLFGDPPPTDQDVPAVHEGYEWGQAFNREWQAAIDS